MARVDVKKNAYRPFIGESKERMNEKNPGVDETMIIEWILRGEDGKLWNGFI